MSGILAKSPLLYDHAVPVSRIVGHAIVIAYLVVVLLGTAHSVRKLSPVPFGRVTIFMYGMLAPYQGYGTTSEGYVAEGLIQGTWYPIDLAPYYPVLPGERSMREWHTYANWAQFPSEEAAHRAFALRLLDLADRDRGGRHIESLRLSWVQWEPAPDVFRTPPIKTRHLVTVP